MNIAKNASSFKQQEYAKRVWSGRGNSKKQIALDVGYTSNVANSVVSKIESKPGFNNAIAKLAAESNCLALSIMAEFKSRGVKHFSDKDLISSLNAIAQAWDRFNKGLIEHQKPPEDNGKNRLKTVILQRIHTQTVNNAPPQSDPVDADFTENEAEEVINMDF